MLMNDTTRLERIAGSRLTIMQLLSKSQQIESVITIGLLKEINEVEHFDNGIVRNKQNMEILAVVKTNYQSRSARALWRYSTIHGTIEEVIKPKVYIFRKRVRKKD